MEAGKSLVYLGPSGVGKSTLLRSALREEGTGAVLMAPGSDEQASYSEFEGLDGYYFDGFDDPEFLPLAGMRNVEGFKRAIQTLNVLFKANKEAIESTGEVKYKVLGIDTVSGLSNLVVNVALKTLNFDLAPPAQSPEGFQYYISIENGMQQLMRPIRALKGLGTHIILLSHVSSVKEASDVATGDRLVPGSHWPAIPGKFKYALTQFADLTVHGGIDPSSSTLRHYVQWQPDPKRPTKSRVGSLGTDAKLPNDWKTIRNLMTGATVH